MRKKFTVSIPDEPFKDSLTQNKTVEITYTGPEFLVISYDPNTNKVQSVDGYFKSADEIDLSNFADDRYKFAVIDAEKNLLEAALLTDNYNHESVDPYIETLPTGEEFIYNYSTNGILDDLFNRWDLKYSLENQTFSKLDYLKFGTSREQFLESLTSTIDLITAEKAKAAEEGATEEELAKYDHVIQWCENFESTYGNIDHWKIPFPTVK